MIIPFFPLQLQYGPGADYSKNDCGLAALVAIEHWIHPTSVLTVDSLYPRFKLKRGATLGIIRLLTIARAIGVNLAHSNHLTPDEIRKELSQQNPIIALLYTGFLPHRPYADSVAHYLVITGWDENTEMFQLMDPLCGFHWAKEEDLDRAMGPEGAKAAKNGVSYQGLVYRRVP